MDNMVNIYKDATAQLQKVVMQTPQRIKKLNELIQRSDWEREDLLHLTEMSNFNASEGYKINRQIKEVQMKRRKYKDELEALNNLRKVINNNSKLEAHVVTLGQTIKSDEERKSKRKYNVRVRTDLKAKFDILNSKGSDSV